MGHDEIQKIHGTTAAIHGTQKFEEPGLVNRIINNCLCSVDDFFLFGENKARCTAADPSSACVCVRACVYMCLRLTLYPALSLERNDFANAKKADYGQMDGRMDQWTE